MILNSGVTVLLLLGLSVGQISSDSCKCSMSPSGGLRVNCISQGLKKIPKLSPDTTELHLQHNQLSSVTPGHFDMLQSLQVVNLSGNPFHCGCDIQYLRTWLLRNQAVVGVGPTCVSPTSLAHQTIAGLSEAEFSACVQHRCSGSLYNIAIGIMLCVLIGLLFWCLRLVKDLTFILGISERHTGFEAESLRSRKPKHRYRKKSFGAGSSSQHDDLERPLLDMEILPQIIDALHKEHNIKFKEM
ncbi:platelet glycoprotein IX [Brachyhypopomus gauderio]|uniref:platelet glycoprotein IX n=1 Tax=Brachyhypopomus gauderio TaxID=698409 RepID=UPI004041B6F5